MPLFGRLRTTATRAKNLSYSKQLEALHSKPIIQEEIVRLNTDEQLFGLGIDSEETRLDVIGGGYALSTIREKQRKGLPDKYVTLFDTGEFYSTFAVSVLPNGFEIRADTVKDGFDLRERWGNALLGLTPQSMEDLQLVAVPELQKQFVNTLLS